MNAVVFILDIIIYCIAVVSILYDLLRYLNYTLLLYYVMFYFI